MKHRECPFEPGLGHKQGTCFKANQHICNAAQMTGSNRIMSNRSLSGGHTLAPQPLTVWVGLWVMRWGRGVSSRCRDGDNTH